MTEQHERANVEAWLADPAPPDVAAAIERIACTEDVRHVAVMPDVHLAGDVCVGTVVATSRLLFPAAVGGDIGCGMASIAFDANDSILSDEVAAGAVLAELYRRVPTNRHSAPTMPASLADELLTRKLSHSRLEKLTQRDGRVQFGTLGRGNHFLEFQVADDGQLWLTVHSGSRAMGQAITSHHLQHAACCATGLECLDSQTDCGRAYLSDVAWAIRYAGLSRLSMLRTVCVLMSELFDILSDETSLVHADHNHVRREEHQGGEYWLHRKGAQYAGLDVPGIIPGSMGTESFHVVGRGCEASLLSCSHGAGRQFSRSVARKRIGRRELHRQLGNVWFDHRRADALRDEAPQAYKDIRTVMRAQKELVRVVRRLRPLLVYKGG